MDLKLLIWGLRSNWFQFFLSSGGGGRITVTENKTPCLLKVWGWGWKVGGESKEERGGEKWSGKQTWSG